MPMHNGNPTWRERMSHAGTVAPVFANPDRNRLMTAIGYRSNQKLSSDLGSVTMLDHAKPSPLLYLEHVGVTLRDWKGNPIMWTSVRLMPSHGNRSHRLLVLCPCSAWVPAGRLLQHSMGMPCQMKRAGK